MTDAEYAAIFDRYIRPAAAAIRQEMLDRLEQAGLSRVQAEAIVASIHVSGGVCPRG